MRKRLLTLTAKDFEWQYFRATGAGGQKRNKTSSACRCKHPQSGAVGICSQHREQRRNRETAFSRCTDTKAFRDWLHLESCRVCGIQEDIERKVEDSMAQHNLKVEVKDDKGRWVALNDEDQSDAA